MSARARYRFRINGRQYDQPIDPRDALSDLLGPEFDRARIETDCVDGACGRCAVLVNGRQVKACQVTAAPGDDAVVTTVEALTNHGFLSRIQQAFLRRGAAPCGRCTPAMLVATTELLARRAAPSRAELTARIAGVRCLCGDYEAILEAMAAAVEVEPEAGLDPRDGPHADVVTGRARAMSVPIEIDLSPAAGPTPAPLTAWATAVPPPDEGLARGFGWGGGTAARLADLAIDRETGAVRVAAIHAPRGEDDPATLRRHTVRGLVALDPHARAPDVVEAPAHVFHDLSGHPRETAAAGARACALAVLDALHALAIPTPGNRMPGPEAIWRTLT